ncbi:hypothetical protein GCM10020255_028710 [Rhodococcus baikonurensis]
MRYVVHPEWYENKEPVAVVTSCGILNTGDEDLADSLIIGGLYSFELRDVTVGQNARRHHARTRQLADRIRRAIGSRSSLTILAKGSPGRLGVTARVSSG